MKVAPIVAAMKARPAKFQPLVVHTGQHYDADMSDSFFRDLQLPQPDTHLGVGSGSHAAQTAAVMETFEPVVLRERPDWVLVVGDVQFNDRLRARLREARSERWRTSRRACAVATARCRKRSIGLLTDQIRGSAFHAFAGCG
jgi:hypothetical protein